MFGNSQFVVLAQRRQGFGAGFLSGHQEGRRGLVRVEMSYVLLHGRLPFDVLSDGVLIRAARLAELPGADQRGQ